MTRSEVNRARGLEVVAVFERVHGVEFAAVVRRELEGARSVSTARLVRLVDQLVRKVSHYGNS